MKDERNSRGAFEGLTEDEIEELYRKNREVMKRQNKVHNKILLEGKIMVSYSGGLRKTRYTIER